MKYNRNVYHSLMMISQFGINMLVPIFFCTFLGIFIDKKCETSYWVIIFFFVGAFAGFRNVFRFAKKIYEEPAVTRRHSKSGQGKKENVPEGINQQDKKEHYGKYGKEQEDKN